MGATQLQDITEKITPILQSNQVVFAGIFGSYARGEEHPASDIDILIRFNADAPKSLLDHIHLEYTLSDALGKKVDLVTEPALHPIVKSRIIKDLTTIYGRR